MLRKRLYNLNEFIFFDKRTNKKLKKDMVGVNSSIDLRNFSTVSGLSKSIPPQKKIKIKIKIKIF